MSKDGTQLHGAIRSFVRDHPHGWGHTEWEGFLAQLRERDIDTTDAVAIGDELERARLLAKLEEVSVKGLGPKRREAVAERYGKLWDLEQASVDEVAAESRLPRQIAEDLHAAIRS